MSEDDRELLVLAAGLAEVHEGFINEYGGGKLFCWNPLLDDGDALRLAMKLSISIDVNGIFVHADCRHCANDVGYFEENSARNGGCISTATRRAIVRAAAGIAEATA